MKITWYILFHAFFIVKNLKKKKKYTIRKKNFATMSEGFLREQKTLHILLFLFFLQSRSRRGSRNSITEEKKRGGKFKKKKWKKGERKKKARTLSSRCTKELFTASYRFCRWNKEASWWRASHSKSRNRLRVKGAHRMRPAERERVCPR